MRSAQRPYEHGLCEMRSAQRQRLHASDSSQRSDAVSVRCRSSRSRSPAFDASACCCRECCRDSVGCMTRATSTIFSSTLLVSEAARPNWVPFLFSFPNLIREVAHPSCPLKLAYTYFYVISTFFSFLFFCILLSLLSFRYIFYLPSSFIKTRNIELAGV